MSESDDSKELFLQNGDDDNESNGLANQETESVDIHHVESKEDMFVDATDDMQETHFQELENGTQFDDTASIDELRALLDKTLADKDSLAKEYKEERESFVKEIANLRGQLRALNDKLLLVDDNRGLGEVVVESSLTEMISECSQLVNSASEERSRSESTIRELHQQIDDLNVKAQLDQNVEAIMDRMLASIGTVVNTGELLDYSVMGKIAHVESCASWLVEQYRCIVYEIDQLKQCLAEGASGVGLQEEFGLGSVFAAACGELMELKKRELEMVEKVNRVEDVNRKLVEEVEKEKAMAETVNGELGKVRVELEQEKHRCANVKEKLSMAVTKGKALVQQRDLLKQSLAETTSELEKCLVELQEKSSALEAAELCKGELVKNKNLVASLQETLSQKNAILGSFEEIFPQTSLPEDLQSMDITERLKWLVNLVASLQEMLSQKDAIFENIEEIFSKISVLEELKSTDIIARLKWLVNWVASLQETILQRNKMLDNLEEIFSQISVPVELQSADTTGRLKWLVEERNALKDNLLEFHKLKDALSLIDLPETASSSDLETRICWLKESVNGTKGEVNMLQDQIARTKEVAHNEIDRLSASLSVEVQEKEYIKTELDDLMHKYEETVEKLHQASSDKNQIVRMLLEGSGIIEDMLDANYWTCSDMAMLIDRCFGKIKEQTKASFDIPCADAEVLERMQSFLYVREQELMLCEKLLEEDMQVRSELSNLSSGLRAASLKLAALKEEKESLLKDLERSEEKSALLREKLSLAVKKGKGLFQDRENMKLLLDEKNSEVEKLKLELQQHEFTVAECRDQIGRLSTDLEKIPRLEADLVAMKDERDQLEQFLLESNNMLQRVIESVDGIVLPVDSVFQEPVAKVNWLAGYVNECQQAKALAEQELDKVKEETNTFSSRLAEAQQTMKSLEDSLSVAKSRISQVAEEKREIEVGKENVEQDLQKAMDEATAHTAKFAEACATRKSLEDALLLAENKMTLLIEEREEAQLGRAATETELEKVREEVAVQTGRLTDAYETIKSLEDALSQAETNISLLTEQNKDIQVGSTNMENELKKLKDEAQSHASKLVDAFTTTKSLEDAVSRAAYDISVLEGEKRIAEEEISTLNSMLKASMDELAGTNSSLESRSVELIHHLGDLQVLMKNDSLMSVITRHFEKEYENLKNMDLILKDIRDHFVDTDAEVLQTHHVMEEDSYVTNPFPCDLGNIPNTDMDNDEVNGTDVDNISLYFKKVADGFQLRNKILAEHFEGFCVWMDEFTNALLRKLGNTREVLTIILEHMESMKQKMKNTEMHKEEQEKTIATLENDCRVLLSACTSATRELQFEVKNKLLQLSSIPELENLNHNLIPEVSELDADDREHQQRLDDSKYVVMAEKLLLATRKVQTLTKLFERTTNVAATTIEDLHNELRETRGASEKAIEERDLIQMRVSELEADVEALQNSCKELRLKVGDYQSLEETLKKEAELSNLHGNLLTKGEDMEESLMSASELRTLFDKISGVKIASTELEIGDVESHSSVDVKKLFYIVDSVNELHHQINVLSHDKDELQSILSTQTLEIELLKEEIKAHTGNKQDSEKLKNEISELTSGLDKIIDVLGGNEIFGDQKSAGVLRLLPALEKQIMALCWEAENSKSQAQELGTKLVGSQKLIDELSTKVKLLEDSLPSRTSQPEIVQETSIFEAPSLPSGSEISEVEDVGSVGKPVKSSVASAAAHVRTMRKGSTDQLALNIDLESGSLLNHEETDEDKGHVFKSLNTSGLIPKQGKSLADRIDGIWVSGGRVLMSRPRARLGLIGYWLFLHVWLLATIL